MNLFEYFILLFFLVACVSSIFYLVKNLKNNTQLFSLAGIFCMVMGFFLLILDLVLISITHGPQYIPDYLQFKRLVSDTGFAGRWVLTVYLFISTSLVITIYLLARNMIRKFNKK